MAACPGLAGRRLVGVCAEGGFRFGRRWQLRVGWRERRSGVIPAALGGQLAGLPSRRRGRCRVSRRGPASSRVLARARSAALASRLRWSPPAVWLRSATSPRLGYATGSTTIVTAASTKVVNAAPARCSLASRALQVDAALARAPMAHKFASSAARSMGVGARAPVASLRATSCVTGSTTIATAARTISPPARRAGRVPARAIRGHRMEHRSPRTRCAAVTSSRAPPRAGLGRSRAARVTSSRPVRRASRSMAGTPTARPSRPN